MDLRVGIGYDVHKLVKNRKLIIGGVNIPFNLGLDGHSDADVLTHAVIDALLGAMCKGDIGTNFPNTDDEYKDISSLILLEKVFTLMEEVGFEIVNIDCIIVAQKPKMSPYMKKMKTNYIEILKCNNINIKATTEENLGFTGNKQGMKAKAICMLKKNK